MDSTTYLKNIRISPKKLRFFLTAVKKKSPSAVMDYLYYARQKPAKILYQAIKSAVSNAKNTLKVNEDLLEWKLFTIEEGQKLKRYRPGGRGTVKQLRLRFSHIKIVLSAKKVEENKDVGEKKLRVKPGKDTKPAMKHTKSKVGADKAASKSK